MYGWNTAGKFKSFTIHLENGMISLSGSEIAQKQQQRSINEIG
jgi:hypothetical protein